MKKQIHTSIALDITECLKWGLRPIWSPCSSGYAEWPMAWTWAYGEVVRLVMKGVNECCGEISLLCRNNHLV